MFSYNSKPLSILNFQRQNIFMSIVEIIRKYLESNGKSLTYLAGKLNIPPQQLINKFNRNKTFDVVFIEAICVALEHDFFSDLSTALRKNHKVITHSMVEEPRAVYGSTVSKNEYDILVKENLELHRELRLLYRENKETEKRFSTLKKQ
jgi:transcriptional regulator with XRE-family HTH domain